VQPLLGALRQLGSDATTFAFRQDCDDQNSPLERSPMLRPTIRPSTSQTQPLCVFVNRSMTDASVIPILSQPLEA